MRTLALVISLFSALELIAQSPNNIGADNSPFLNGDEIKLLNFLLEEQRDTFEFANKKVAFVTGSSGSMIVRKSEYFKKSVVPWIERDSRPQISIILLSEEEKIKSNGYDVLVLSWVKLFTDRRKRKTIEQLAAIN